MKELYRVVPPSGVGTLIETDNLYDNSSFKEEVINAIDYLFGTLDMELMEIMADYFIKHDLCESQLDMTIEKIEVKRDEQKEETEMTPAIIEKALMGLRKFCSNQSNCDDCPFPKYCSNYFNESPMYWFE